MSRGFDIGAQYAQRQHDLNPAVHRKHWVIGPSARSPDTTSQGFVDNLADGFGPSGEQADGRVGTFVIS